MTKHRPKMHLGHRHPLNYKKWAMKFLLPRRHPHTLLPPSRRLHQNPRGDRAASSVFSHSSVATMTVPPHPPTPSLLEDRRHRVATA